MRRVSAATILTALTAGVAIWLSFGSLAVTDAASGRRIGLLAPLWLLALSTAAMLGLSYRVAGTRVPHAAVVVLLILLPWLPMPVPDAFLIWTGPVVRLVWIAAGVYVLQPSLRHVARRLGPFLVNARVAPRIACVLAFVASLAVHYRQQILPLGDEPHYLLIAHSLLVDHDLVVSNNYEQRDYLAYYAGPLWPHYARPAKDGSLYSLHGPGLPALIAPALAIGGYRAVVLWIAAIAALGTFFVWKAAHALTSDVAAAWVAWAAVALTAPAVLESTLIYPDAVAGTVLGACVLAMLAAPSLSVRAAAALGAAIGVLPWLHTRFAPLAAILVALVAFRLIGPGGRRRWPPALLGLGIPIVVSVAGWFLFAFHVYGTFDPMAGYGGGTPLEPGRMLSGLVGLAADQEFGLIPNAPVHLLWIGGALALAKKYKRLLLELACIAVPYVLTVAAFPNWFGGSTPARYLAPLVFPLSVTVAPLWCRQDGLGRSLSMALLTVSVLVASAFGFGASGMLAYNAGQGRSVLLEWISPLVNLPGGFPSYFRAITADGITRASLRHELLLPCAIWAMAAILIWSLARWIHRRSASNAVSRPALAAGCVVAVLSISVTSTWASAKVPHLAPTRAQLGLIAREDPRTTPLGVQLWPLHLMPSAEALQRLEVSTSPFDVVPSGVMLNLSEVASGEYRLRLKFFSEPRGEISLSVGGTGGPLAAWDVSSPENTYSFRIPIQASQLTIAASPAAAASLRSVAMTPVQHFAPSGTATMRARAAARYGRTVVYAIDNRIVLEPDGFWVLGGRQPDVVMTKDDSPAGLTFRLSNVAVRNRVRVSTSTWSASRDLAPDERWLVTVPVSDAAQPAIVNFRVEHGATVGGRFLGCRVSVVE